MAQHPDHQAANQPLDNVLPELDPNTQSSSTAEHRAQASGSVRCFVLTVSDTRTAENDGGGQLIQQLLRAGNHEVVGSRIVRDEGDLISAAANEAINGINDPEVLIVTGGSGISPRDVTPEALRPLLTKEMPGFGEVFRVLSWDEVGAASMLSRAFAGVVGRTLLFVLPGSTNAVRLAMEKLIVPELGHLVREVRPERRQ
jgi:molybdenum cofactor biosynthesis protein B